MSSSKKSAKSKRVKSKHSKTAKTAKAAPRGGAGGRVMGWFREDAAEEEVPDGWLLLVVFAIAMVARFVYLTELNDAPWFHHPVGDSRVYHDRAVEITGGDLIGREAYFHSSPLYSYFMALVYSVFGVNFTALRVIQFVIGSANCALIYLLVRRMAPWAKAAPLAAGVAAALYGTLAFFDGDLLMAPLVLLFTCASVWLLALLVDPEAPVGEEGRAALPRGWKPALLALAAGAALGLAGLGKPNVLVFAPFAVVWIVTGFGRSFVARRWREALLFVVGCAAAVAPITLRNYAVSQDFVLVSSNAGVNFYIGNNEKAEGIYMLPPESGLDNTRLYLSSRDAAQAATGREDLKPSEVSAYWTAQALDFYRESPAEAASLLWHKFRLFWNHYEIPNHHNKYFVATQYTPSLKAMFIGYKLVAPLAVMGIVLAFMTLASSPVVRLYLGFVFVYMLTLIPFFITARYRLPVVPFLVAFAVVGLWKLAELLQRKQWRPAGIAAGTGVIAAVFVSWPMMTYDFGFNHTVVGSVYADLATEQPDDAVDHIENAIIEYKTTIELRPMSVDAHYNLGVAYQRIGFHSGAVKELEIATRLQPTHSYASKALVEARASLEESGDRIDAAAVPRTLFERGVDYTKRGQKEQAALMYAQVLKSDPHHAGAWSQAGAIRFDEGDYREAIRLFKKGLKYKPDHFVLNNNIAGAYYKTGDNGRARRHWEKCLEIDPDNESVKRQLRLLEDS